MSGLSLTLLKFEISPFGILWQVKLNRIIKKDEEKYRRNFTGLIYMYISTNMPSKKETAIQEESCMTAVWDLCVNAPVIGLYLLRGIIQL